MTRMLLYGDSFKNANAYYLTGFLAPDPIIYLADGEDETLVVPPLEKGRAEKESRIEDVKSFDDLGYQEALDQSGEPASAIAAVIERLIGSRPSNTFSVEAGFPVLIADILRSHGISLVPDPSLLESERRFKSEEEVAAIAKAQARAELAISQAADILTESEILDDAIVYRGVPLTSERLRSELAVAFAGDNFMSDGMIIAPGPQSSDPHWIGAGPIRPHQPLILDIFPQDGTSRYFGDVTRTFVKGSPSEGLLRMQESVRRAQAIALDMIGPGVNGRDVHSAVVDVFARDGYSSDGRHQARYIHGTGHGLGLEIHEQPRLSRLDVELKAGDVVTVEPGLYDPELGGVRIEDVVVVTANGNRNLNRLPKDLVIH